MVAEILLLLWPHILFLLIFKRSVGILKLKSFFLPCAIFAVEVALTIVIQ